MPDYRQYVLGSHGHNADMLEQSCYNDPDARDQARPLADGRDIGIRAAARKSGRVTRGGAPLDAADPGSL